MFKNIENHMKYTYKEEHKSYISFEERYSIHIYQTIFITLNILNTFYRYIPNFSNRIICMQDKTENFPGFFN